MGIGGDMLGINIFESADQEYVQDVSERLKESVRHDGVGDINGTEKGSGARFNAGKPDLSLIPLCTLTDEALVWGYGAKKYTRNNWQKGMNWSIPLACALRHIAAWQRGEEFDDESGLPHLAHAICNLRMLTLYSKTFKEGDDREYQWTAGF